ncbi:MAG: hypothetical protein GKR94_05110 [Gammaproteobacteria bacterium]|nr:hypothetical protein [Gammaproteobacteria bacterium]
MFTLPVVVIATAFAVFLVLRLWPIWPSRWQGCDAFYILLSAEFLRAQRRLPIRIPRLYMLEGEEQAYPPGFLILCALLPAQWLKRYYWLLNHILDLGSAAALGAAALLTGAHWATAAAAIMLYALTAANISEFMTLNTRPLGLLMINIFLLSAYLGIDSSSWQAVCITLGVVLVFCHKLSMQMLWATMPILSTVTGDWYWVALLLASYGIAFIIWPRGTWRIVYGHWVIVRFWFRNWPLLGAHAVRQSPIYGDAQTHEHYYADASANAALRFTKDAFHHNYFVIPSVVIVATSTGSDFNFSLFLASWIASAYILGFAVHFIHWLRAIGLGRQYFKFAVLPSLLLTGIHIGPDTPVITWAAIACALVLTVRQYLLLAMASRRHPINTANDPDLCAAIAMLRRDKDARIMALPVQLGDLIAYRTRRPVYWGTHSDVFDERLEDFFPVLRKPLHYYVEDGVNRLLLDTHYATAQILNLDESTILFRGNRYQVHQLPSANHTQHAGDNTG